MVIALVFYHGVVGAVAQGQLDGEGVVSGAQTVHRMAMVVLKLHSCICAPEVLINAVAAGKHFLMVHFPAGAVFYRNGGAEDPEIGIDSTTNWGKKARLPCISTSKVYR